MALAWSTAGVWVVRSIDLRQALIHDRQYLAVVDAVLFLRRCIAVVVMSNRTSCVNFAQNREQASNGAVVAGRGRTARARSCCPD